MADDPFKYFRVEARELAEKLGQGILKLERGEAPAGLVAELLRHAHTLKGAARVVRQPAIAEHAHAIEELLLPVRDSAGPLGHALIDTVLKRVDAITSGVRALGLPDAPPGAGAQPAAPAETAADFAPVAIDGDLEGLVRDVVEAYAQLDGLNQAAALAAQAGQAVEAMAGDLGALTAARGGPANLAATRRLRAGAEALRGTIQGLIRSLGTTQERIERELRQVHEDAERLRLVRAGSLFPALERAARDVARALDRQIAFEVQGGDVRVDAAILRVLQDALTQTVRNAVAHGIEPAAERVAAGKPAQGRVRIAVAMQGQRITFRCEDDGRGLDLDGLRAAAIARGAAPEALRHLDAQGVVALTLRGGVSTTPVASQVSGRGIGMDIVRDALARLGGQVSVETTAGAGTVFTFVAPVSITTLEVLNVEYAGRRAAVPLAAVRRALRLDPGDVRRTPDGDAIIYEGAATPLARLDAVLGGGAARSGTGATAIVVAGARGLAAVAVDRLLNASHVTVSALPDLMHGVAAVAGATLDADGAPSLVLDADGLVAAAIDGATSVPATAAPARPLLVVDDSPTTRILEQSILETAGYEVDAAVSGEEALELLRRRDYALVLCDVEMPGMDGFTFTEHLRRDPAFRDLPVFLVTSRDSPADIQRGKDAGAQEYVVKSAFDQAWLIQRIRAYVR